MKAPEPPSREVTVPQVKAARALLGWTQLDLATKAHLGSATIADFERAKRTANVATLRAIVLALNMAGVQFIPGGVVKR